MLQAQCDGSELSLRLLQAYARFQARDREKAQAGARQSPVDRIRRTPDVALVREVESRGENSYDRQRLIGNAKPLPQNGSASAKMTLPIRIADQRCSGIPGFLLLRTEEPAQRRRHSKSFKELCAILSRRVRIRPIEPALVGSSELL